MRHIKNPSLSEELPPYEYLVGGAIRDLLLGEKPNDWDLFYSDSKIYIRAIEWLTNKGFKMNRVGPIKEGDFRGIYQKYSGKYFGKVNIDIMYFPDQDIKKYVKEQFDFTINMAVYHSNGDPKKRFDPEDIEFLSKKTKQDIKNRELRINNKDDDIAYLVCRLRKFADRGFTITDDSDYVLIEMVNEILENRDAYIKKSKSSRYVVPSGCYSNASVRGKKLIKEVVKNLSENGLLMAMLSSNITFLKHVQREHEKRVAYSTYKEANGIAKVKGWYKWLMS